MDPQLADLKNAHRRLLARYVELLDEVAHAGWLMPRLARVAQRQDDGPTRPPWWSRLLSLLVWAPANQAQGTSTALRFLVRLFVEGHLRSQLKDLGEAYLYLRAQIGPDAKDDREWAKECSEVCDKMAGTLASWTSIEGLAKLFWPLALSAVTAWFGVKDIWEAVGKLDLDSWLIIYATLLFPIIYVFIFMSTAFAYKRQMFLPGYDANEISFAPGAIESADNLYALEDRLFDLLGRQKARERSWDRVLVVFSCLAFGSVPFWSLLLPDQDSMDWKGWFSGGVFWIFALIGMLAPQKRRWQ